jgi:hypothetical protein
MRDTLCLKIKTFIDEKYLSLRLEGAEGLETFAVRSEGKLITTLQSKTFRIDLQSPFFRDVGFSSKNLCGDRLCLAALMVFAPTFSAVATDETQRSYFGIQDRFPEFDKVTLCVDFEVSDALKSIFRHVWMLPKLNIVSGKLNPQIPREPKKSGYTSIPWGGGLDSTAALILFEDMPFCTPYTVARAPCPKVEKLKYPHNFEVSIVETNCKLLYSDQGWPIWTAPVIPALIRGDTLCSPGTTNGSLLSDGYRYRPHKNLWLSALEIAGLTMSLAHSVSEYTASQIVYRRGLARLICGTNCSEWGVSYKSLRKALYMASFDEDFYRDVQFLESRGLVIDFDKPFTERSKFSMDVAEAVYHLQGKLESASISNVSPKIDRFRKSWNIKAPLSTQLSFVSDVPSSHLEYLKSAFRRQGIELMNSLDIDGFKSFDYTSQFPNA